MKKIALLLVLVAIIFLLGLVNDKKSSTIGVSSLASSPKNATYQIEGVPITLINGSAETEIVPGSASKIVTRYFGNEVTADFNGDGTSDTAFILTQENGGSGTFYYVAIALQTEKGYIGTNAIFLGDRIAPQATEVKDKTLIVNYAERGPTDPMTSAPSVGVSKYLQFTNGLLQETKEDSNNTTLSKEARCLAQKGTWDASHNECLGIDAALCTSIGGVFNECASACRHNPNAEMCTMQCVQICTVK